RICKKRRDSSTFPATIAMNADDRIADRDATADDTPERNSSEIIAVIQIRHQHLKKWLARNFWRWHMLDDRLKERRHVLVVFMQLTHSKAILRARVNDWEIELLIARFQFDKKIENHVDDPMRSCVFSIDLIDDNDRLEFVLQRLAQNKARLRLRPIVRIDHEQHAVHHLHDPLDFASKIGVTGRIDDVDSIAVPLKGRVLRANRNSFLTLEIHRIHYPFLDLLIGAKRARLPQQLIDQRRLAVIDVRNDGDVADFIHLRGALSKGRSAPNMVARLSCVKCARELSATMEQITPSRQTEP